MPAQDRLKNFFQRATPAKDAGLHRADAAFQNLADFLVAQAFEVSQNHCATKDIGNLLQSAVDDHLNFQSSELLEGRGAKIFDLDAGLPFLRLGINGNIFLHMALEPALDRKSTRLNSSHGYISYAVF